MILESDLSATIRNHLPPFARYEELREALHANPDLSGCELETAKTIANNLRSLSTFLEIHERIGGTGIAAVFRNGSGKTVLLRCELDALPISEQTSYSFASDKTRVDRFGKEKPAMHACGHEIHMVVLLAAADTLIRMASLWQGTFVLVFQPAEEIGTGAQAMVDDGLCSRIPVPDVLFNQHVYNGRAGKVGVRPGQIMAAADHLKIVFFGRGGPGSHPHATVDPIVIAASAVLRLQTIVSREIEPGKETAVVTVGRIVAGEAENVIPDRAEIGVSVRTVSEATREKVLAAIRRIVKGESDTGNAPRDPEITQTAEFPPTVNDVEITKKLIPNFASAFGSDFTPDFPLIHASEDFPVLARAFQKPYVNWFYGSTSPDRYDEAEKRGELHLIPQNHSPSFSAVTQPTLKVGVIGLCTAALTILLSS